MSSPEAMDSNGHMFRQSPPKLVGVLAVWPSAFVRGKDIPAFDSHNEL